jgi:hypothetical protein
MENWPYCEQHSSSRSSAKPVDSGRNPTWRDRSPRQPLHREPTEGPLDDTCAFYEVIVYLHSLRTSIAWSQPPVAANLAPTIDLPILATGSLHGYRIWSQPPDRSHSPSRSLGGRYPLAMAEFFSKLFDIGKLPSKVVSLIFLVSAVLLFAPSWLNESLRTTTLVEKYGLYLGLAFLSSAVLLGLNVFIWISGHVARAMTKWRWRRDLRRAIGRLDRGEMAVLREFWIQGKQSLMLPVDEPTVAGLINKSMIGRISNLGRRSLAGCTFPVSIDADLYDALSKHPEYLGLSATEPTREDIERIRAERPGFIREIAQREGLRSGF